MTDLITNAVSRAFPSAMRVQQIPLGAGQFRVLVSSAGEPTAEQVQRFHLLMRDYYSVRQIKRDDAMLEFLLEPVQAD